jgi:hypothetical protein
MSSANLLNILALGISLLSLAITGLIAARQSTLMRHSNELPIFVELTQEYRSEDYQRAELYVLRQLSTEQPASRGISNLPEGPRMAVTRVFSFYSALGAYVALGLADEQVVISLLGYSINRAWSALEPYILRERTLRNDDYHLIFFEELVCRTRDNWPPHVAYNHNRLRLRDESKPWRQNPVLPPDNDEVRRTSSHQVRRTRRLRQLAVSGPVRFHETAKRWWSWRGLPRLPDHSICTAHFEDR